MKTTMILPDLLLQKAKSFARKRGTNMTRLMEDALRQYLAAESARKKKSSWSIEPVGKGGFVSTEFEGNWSKMRDALYGEKV